MNERVRVEPELLEGTGIKRSLRSRIFAAVYDAMNAGGEQYLAPFRARTAGRARGAVLEIGGGTGANLPHYPPDCRLTVLEPNPHMAKRLRGKAAALGREVTVVVQGGESLPFPDGSFDAVVATLVLCSVADQSRVLGEIRRVLRPSSPGRPGGALLYFEHVAARDERLRRWQRRITPLWSFIGDGCHLDRDTGAAIRAAGFATVEIGETQMPVGFSLTRPCIIGRATA